MPTRHGILPAHYLTSYFTAATKRLTDTYVLFAIISFAALSFCATLILPSVGEEGVYTNITLEMLHSKNYLVPTLYGVQYARPPLFNWLILVFTNVLGPTNIVIAARLVNMLATLATAAVLAWLVRRIFADRKFALFAAAAYLSGDLLFKRGWIAYADSLFALCIFTAVACLWVALETKQTRWLVVATLSLCCAFLAKVQTAYIFYGVAGLVLLWRHSNRKFLFSPQSWILHSVAVFFPLVWTIYINHGYGGISTTLMHSKGFFAWPGLLNYAFRTLIYYPADVAQRFLPISFIAIFALWKMPKLRAATQDSAPVLIIFWITLLNVLPYWIVPYSNIRYILPIYPLLALLGAYVVWHSTEQLRKFAVCCLIGAVVLKYIFALYWLPYEHNIFRGNAAAVALAIHHKTQGYNLYTNDSRSPGLRVAVELNKLRVPLPPLTLAPAEFVGYVLSDRYDASLGELVETYNLRNDKIYLSFGTGAHEAISNR